MPSEVPLEAYHNRAANNPVPWLIPLDVTEPAHGIREGFTAAAAGQCFYPDTSEFQDKPYDASFPYPVASFRFHTGYRLDNLAAGNWAYHQAAIASGRTRVLFAYAVFIPGQLSVVMAGIRSLFGATCPTNRLVLMIDMESSSNGFAGPGDHSAEANSWAQTFADYTGTPTDWLRSVGYANQGDWASNWPGHDARLKQGKAAYTASDPSPWWWQYAGGNPAYPVPAGFPRTCAPWSDRYIDMNVINVSIDELEQQLGIATPEPEEDDDMPAAPGAIFEVVGSPSNTMWVIHYGHRTMHQIDMTEDPIDRRAFIAAGFIDCTADVITGAAWQWMSDAFAHDAPSPVQLTDAQITAIAAQVPGGATSDDVDTAITAQLPAIAKAVLDAEAARLQA